MDVNGLTFKKQTLFASKLSISYRPLFQLTFPSKRFLVCVVFFSVNQFYRSVQMGELRGISSIMALQTLLHISCRTHIEFIICTT